MTYTQTERLRMIDCLLANYGNVGREILMDWFGVSSACATRDLALYREIRPTNLYFCTESKRWQRAACFKPVVAPATVVRPHDYWRAGEPDCPADIKAPNGELHTLRCRVCCQSNPRSTVCAGVVNRFQEGLQNCQKMATPEFAEAMQAAAEQVLKSEPLVQREDDPE